MRMAFTQKVSRNNCNNKPPPSCTRSATGKYLSGLFLFNLHYLTLRMTKPRINAKILHYKRGLISPFNLLSCLYWKVMRVAEVRRVRWGRGRRAPALPLVEGCCPRQSKVEVVASCLCLARSGTKKKRKQEKCPRAPPSTGLSFTVINDFISYFARQGIQTMVNFVSKSPPMVVLLIHQVRSGNTQLLISKNQR